MEGKNIRFLHLVLRVTRDALKEVKTCLSVLYLTGTPETSPWSLSPWLTAGFRCFGLT